MEQEKLYVIEKRTTRPPMTMRARVITATRWLLDDLANRKYSKWYPLVEWERDVGRLHPADRGDRTAPARKIAFFLP